MPLNPQDAPPGYVAVAVPGETTPCEGCAFWSFVRASRECVNNTGVSCMSYKRKDCETVVFVAIERKAA